jgi:3-oxoacyl-[acyl-carrier protein] reductase
MSVVLITGGSRGIGRAMVEAFAAAGHSVAFTYQSNEAAARELAPSLAIQADVRDRPRAGEVFVQVENELGPIDVLINNAGIKRDGAFHRMSVEDWNAVLDTNLNGVFHYSQLAVAGMLRRGGVILNVTSVSGILGIAGQTNYGASKAAVVGLTKSLAKEVARFEIRVNAIAPGFIETDMIDAMPQAARDKAFAQIPMRKPGDPAQVAQLALYLASPQASYVTGQIFPIDGGLS